MAIKAAPGLVLPLSLGLGLGAWWLLYLAKAIALVTLAGAQNTSSGPSDRPRGPDCSHPADLGE